MKKLIFTLGLLFLCSNAWAATRTISVAGGNWNTAATWVEVAVPTSADDVVATGLSGNLTVDVSAACKTIDMTNYTGTLTINASQQLAVAGNFKFVSGMTFADNSTAGIVINGANTSFDTGGKTLKALTFQNVAVALASDVTMTSTFSPGSGNITGSFNLYCQGDVNVNNFGTWTPTINFTGSANQEWIGGAGQNYNAPTVINKSGGTLTISGTHLVGFANKPVVITYTAGTVNHTGTLGIRGSGSSVTLNTNGMSWNNVTFGSYETPTVTLSSLMTATGTTTVSANSTLAGTGGLALASLTINASKTFTAGENTITLSGNFTNNGTFTANTSTVTFSGATSHTIDGTTTFNNFTCPTGETCSFDDADIFTISGTGVGNGTWTSDHATNTVDIDFTAETISSGAGTRVDSAGGVAVTTSGTITSCVNWTDGSAPASTANFLMFF